MNQTIYFRKDIWSKFEYEKNKSNLINQLLSIHYGLDPREVSISDEPIPTEFVTITKNPDTVNEVTKVVKKNTKLCQHFQPKGMCMVKKCQ